VHNRESRAVALVGAQGVEDDISRRGVYVVEIDGGCGKPQRRCQNEACESKHGDDLLQLLRFVTSLFSPISNAQTPGIQPLTIVLNHYLRENSSLLPTNLMEFFNASNRDPNRHSKCPLFKRDPAIREQNDQY
jgi:hypothetical protein